MYLGPKEQIILQLWNAIPKDQRDDESDILIFKLAIAEQHPVLLRDVEGDQLACIRAVISGWPDGVESEREKARAGARASLIC